MHKELYMFESVSDILFASIYCVDHCTLTIYVLAGGVLNFSKRKLS